MPVLDFKEIPNGKAEGEIDAFELFAREFFAKIYNFRIESEPNRGADGGKDIIAVEIQQGALSNSAIKWLISCKHNAHSNKSVNENDEKNIIDRLEQHNAAGFIGFYSTLPSSGLNDRLDGYRNKYKIEVFNHERIETELLEKMPIEFIKRFFPQSIRKWTGVHASKILSNYEPLKCICCKKDLLEEPDNKLGIVVFIKNRETNMFSRVYACCKGSCDMKLLQVMRGATESDSWMDISDFIIPTVFLKKTLGVFNNLRNNRFLFTDDSFEQFKSIYISLSQFALRPQSDSEFSRAVSLSSIDGL